MKVVFVLLALVFSACFAQQKCKTTTECSMGYGCVNGICKFRPECPMYKRPPEKKGCKIVFVLDEKKCNKYKLVC